MTNPSLTTWNMRTAPRLRSLLAAAFIALAPAIVMAQEGSAEITWQRFLEDAGIKAEDLDAFDEWSGSLTEPQADLAARIIFRLEQWRFIGGSLAPPAASTSTELQDGKLVTVSGRASDITKVNLPPSAGAALEQDELFQCRITPADGSTVTVLSRRAPAAWLNRSPRLLDEPVTVQGVFVGSMRDEGRMHPLVIASRIEWRPESNVSAGVAWLAERGFDAALLDEIRHGRAFAKPHESLESLAFYRCLAIVAGSSPEELIQLARATLPAKVEEAQANLADARAKRESLTEKWNDATPAERKQLRDRFAAARRRQAIAAGVVERAERGTSSVVPLFLEPQKNTGEAVLIEGTARRAIRIVLDEDARRAANADDADAERTNEPHSLTEYYELDVFTTDSQNLPVICCVARLPEGFPIGDAIREPVRIGGIFFKQWSYVRREDNAAVSMKNRPPERLHPPLVVAAAPQWLRTTEPATPQYRGLWAGLAFLAVFLVMVVTLLRVSRRDRLAQARQARYDSPLENIAEP
ncbi:MAG TPA: hypothetical protein VF175_06745 [Lacipirellula sp.]